MHEEVPPYLNELLCAQYGGETAQRIAAGYAARRAVTLRANRLKTDAQAVYEALTAQGIALSRVPWSEDAFICEGVREDALTALPLYERGEIYLQSLSSMLPPLLLGAQPGENVLDMAAAPGGKTTQLAALTGNRAMITACEMNRGRAERLRFNVQRQGATRVTVMNVDSRKLDDLFSFERILLDAPCSGSGTVQLGDPRSKGQFTQAYLEKTARAQRALLDKALRLLRPGCEMIYSTCSVLQKENEDVVRGAVASGRAQVVPLAAPEGVPVLPVSLPGTLCVCPDELYEGFFVAKLKRVK